MSISNVTIHLDVTPEHVVLHDAAGRFPVLQFGTELTLHVDQTPTATMQAVIDLLTKAMAARETGTATPVQVAAEDGVRHLGVPYQRDRRAA